MSGLTLKQQRAPRSISPAARLPIARVLVDTGLSHLDQPYDYLVTADQDHKAQPGVRVRVRFAGRLVDGWLLERREESDYAGKLSPLASVVSPEVVLTPALQRSLAQVADHFAGSLWDVVRTAIPPRHAKTESLPSEAITKTQATSVSLPRSGLEPYPKLPQFLSHLDKAPRAVLAAVPGLDPFRTLADVVAEVASQNRGALVVVPDERDLVALEKSLNVDSGVVILRANLSPSERYRRYLRISRGIDRVVIGTRAAVFAPVSDLGLIVVWDDGGESHYEQHAPGWNTRDVAAIRSHVEKVGLLIAGHSVSVDSARWLESSWAKLISSDQIKSLQPRVLAADEEPARVSSRTWKVIKEASSKGPVLISVARTGYLPGLQCQKCRSRAVCHCGGPLVQAQGAPPHCQICHALHEKYECASCGGVGLRAVSVGIERTIEEIGKAFPQRTIRHSTGERPIAVVAHKPLIVVSTQGVEPRAKDGYEAVVILDAYATLYRPVLRADEEARRRWFNTAALVKPGGEVVIACDGTHPAVQSLIRWSPSSAAEIEFRQRMELHMPPAWEFAVVDIDVFIPEVAQELAELGEVLGPISREDGVRMIVRAPKGLAPALRDFTARRSARRQATRIRLNPYSV